MIFFQPNEYYLLMIWLFTGLFCLIPLFITISWKKFFIIPLLFISVYLSFYSNKELLATPWHGKPSGKFLIIEHSTREINGQKYIILWAKTDKDKLYIYPYNKEDKKELENAKNAKDRGVAMVGKFVKKSNDKNKNSYYEVLRISPIDYEHEFPKEK